MLTVGSLFSGIGGFDLGLERAGMRCVWQCESDSYCQRVLAKHWPDVLRVRDVRDVHAGAVPWVDVLCGGFPCQDISVAGKGAGIDGERSGLWGEFARLIGELRPRYALVENVAALTSRGLDTVLADLAASGFDAEWDCLPASAFGAPHRRDRLWLVAYPSSPRRRQDARGAPRDEAAHEGRPAQDHHLADGDGQSHGAGAVAAADGAGRGERRRAVAVRAEQPAAERGGEDVPDAEGHGRREGWPGRSSGAGADGEGLAPQELADADGDRARWPGPRLGRPGRGHGSQPGGDGEQSPWAIEPDVGRVADGVPARVDRLRSLGNALVPQIAEWIGRRILEWESMNA